DSRHQLLQGMPDFPDLAALNAWLKQRCMELWRQSQNGTLTGTIDDVRAEEKAALMPLPVAFDGFIELSNVSRQPALSVSSAIATAFRRRSRTSLSTYGPIRTDWSWRPRATSCANIPVSSSAAISIVLLTY